MNAQELIDQRKALVEARSSGTLRVLFRSGGTQREIEYRSVADIERAIAAIDRDLAAMSGKRVLTFLPSFSNGL